MSRFYRPPFLDYQEALDKFTALRAQLNKYIEEQPQKFLASFQEVKEQASKDDTVAMDILAYYYKSGVPGLLPENYEYYLQWEIVSAAKGNELAIEKLQFLLGFAISSITQSEQYQTIVYKNEIADYDTIYVLGKAICKMLAKEHSYFPIDMAKRPDVEKKFTQEAFIIFRKQVDEILPKTIDFLIS